MNNMDFIFFNVERICNEKGITQLAKVVAIKTNQSLKRYSRYECAIDNSHYRESLASLLMSFEKWVGSPYTSKFVTFNKVDLQLLVEEAKKTNSKFKTKDFYKIMNYQYWNIQNEMSYRLGVNKNTSLEDFLSIYGLSFVGSHLSAENACYNTLSLVEHFKYDEERNKDVFVNRDGNHSPHPQNFPQLKTKTVTNRGEEMLLEKMSEGWFVSFQCQPKERALGVRYEGVAYPLSIPSGERLDVMRFGEGDSLEMVMLNLFDKWTEDNDYQQTMKKNSLYMRDLLVGK